MQTGINESNQYVVLGKNLHKSLQDSEWTGAAPE